MPRRRGRRNPDQPIWNPMPGDFAWTLDGFQVRIVDRMRSEGIHMAVVRYQDKEHQQSLPANGMAPLKVRDLLKDPPEGADAGVADQPRAQAATPSGNPPITFDVVNTVNTPLQQQFDFGVHAHGCADVKRDRKMYRCDVYHHHEATAEEVVQAEIDDLEGSGFSREEAENFTFRVFPCAQPAKAKAPARRKRRSGGKSADLQDEKSSLQAEPKTATVARGKRGKAKSTTTTRRTSMARRTASTKEPEAKTSGKGRGRKTAAKAETKATNGNGRRTHEDILDLVPEIVGKLKDGVTMTDIRAEYGAGPVIRKALTEKGYNTKGEKIETPDLTDLTGKRLAKAVADLREEGKAWYFIELATDMGQADLQELLEENGYSELASGRVVVAREDDEDEEEEKPKRSRSRAKAETSSGSGRKRGSAKSEAKSEAPARRRGRRRNRPSDED